MGTRLIARGLDLAVDDPALWLADHSDQVFEVHRRDFEAGADAVVTNTFGANSAWLRRFGRHDEAPAFNHRATRLARMAAGPDRFVLGSIGPTATDHPPSLLEQAEALLSGRDTVDALLLETHRFDQAEVALRLLRGCRVPIITSLYAWPEPIADAAQLLVDLGAEVLGANCIPGMRAAIEIARRLGDACDQPLLMKPAASGPGVDPEAPESFEAAIPELLDLGVRLIGGCCGSTEAHVSALRRGLDRRAAND